MPTSENEPPSPPAGPALPVVALVLSVLGLCMPPLLLVSGALGIYCYLRARRQPQWAPRKQIAQLTTAVSAAGLLVFAGLALPNYKLYRLRTRQVNWCHQTLLSLHAAQSRLHAKQKRFTIELSELDWAPAAGQLVRLSASGPLAALPPEQEAYVPQRVREALGLRGECPACSTTMMCAAQLDSDPTLDVWTVSTEERTGSLGEKISAGVPWNEIDDVTQ